VEVAYEAFKATHRRRRECIGGIFGGVVSVFRAEPSMLTMDIELQGVWSCPL
jgi:hypothetical protein